MIGFDALADEVPGVVEADMSATGISDVEHDSRRVGAGTLFACIPGAVVDGHDFAADAVGAGASRPSEKSTRDLPGAG